MKLRITFLLLHLTNAALIAGEANTQLAETVTAEKKEAPQKSIEVLNVTLSQGDTENSEVFNLSNRIALEFTVNAIQAGKINVVWVRDEQVYATILMNIKGAASKWGGRSNITALVGNWKVQIKDESDQLLSEKIFTVVDSNNKKEQETDSSNAEYKKKTKEMKEVLTSLEPEKK